MTARPLLPILASCSLAALASCAPPSAARAVAQELGPVPPSAARVCVLRPGSVGEDVIMEIRDNGRLVGATRGRTFACWLAVPGEHQIASADDDTGPMLLRARAGGRYWLHQDVTALGPDLHAHLDWVGEETAAELLAACDGRVLLDVPGHDGRTDAVAIAPAKPAARAARELHRGQE
jgi:hypothetical protein